jgi:NAD(P)-dependent dehydrogenase (short-subunit alcohol dehydrogenase family)
MDPGQQYAQYPSLKDKTVFVTGGGTGIGESIVRAFCEQGARLAFVDIAAAASKSLCERIASDGFEKPLFRYCDIRDIPALRNAMQALSVELGDFDVLVNNAGNDERHRIDEVTPEYWDDRIAVNLRPMFFACQSVFPGMQKKGAGSIVNLGSIGWHIASGGYPVYSSTKAAVSGLTRGLARDMGRHNVRVNTVTPGWVMTERQMTLWVDAAAEEQIKHAQCLPGRLLPPHIARMVLFLAADDSAMCTAQEFIVDGGWS